MKEASQVYEALGNDVRLQIVRMIAKAGRLYCGDIRDNFQLSQPTMSHHLTKLVRAGVLTEMKEGVRHCYEINGGRLVEVGINLKAMTA